MSIVSHIWKPFGLRGTPYFQEELRVDPGARYPVDRLFVHREAELRTLGRRLGSGDPTRTIIEGQAGIGKTSFVNRLKAELSAHGAFALHSAPISMRPEMAPDRLLADVLRVLIRIRTNAGAADDAFWSEISHLVHGQTLRGVGVTIAGFGGSFGAQRAPAETGTHDLARMVEAALSHIHDEFGTAVVFHLNNLENLTLAGAKSARVLIQTLRDVFLQPHAHWIFSGTEGMATTIFRHTEQVGGIFPTATVLDPLASGELVDLLQRRYDFLRIADMALVPPVEPPVLAALYRHYRGDLRNFLRLLNDASESILGVDGIRPMTEGEVSGAVRDEYRARLVNDLSADDFAYLVKILRIADDRAFRVAEVRGWIDLTQAGASGVVARLQEAGAIRSGHRRGRSIYYQPSGSTRIALGLAG